MNRQPRDPELPRHLFKDDGRIPNNPELPLLVYTGVLPASGGLPLECEALFRENGWEGVWRDKGFTYHHYHSTAHNVLGIVSGTARLAFGGELGVTIVVEAGDVAVISAGVGHCNSGSREEFLVVGAYPRGQHCDLRTGEPGERAEVIENIRRVPFTGADPVFGNEGPLTGYWAG
jgi:uncharacterized protein YjlB